MLPSPMPFSPFSSSSRSRNFLTTATFLNFYLSLQRLRYNLNVNKSKVNNAAPNGVYWSGVCGIADSVDSFCSRVFFSAFFV